MTTGFRDGRTGALFSSDCFGAPVTELLQALADDAAEIPAAQLLPAQHLWALADSPWVTMVDRTKYAQTLRELGRGRLPLVLSTHLPPARDAGEQLLDALAGAPDAPEMEGPDQAALEAMLAGFAPEQRTGEDVGAPA